MRDGCLQPDSKPGDFLSSLLYIGTLKTGEVEHLLMGHSKATLILWVFGAKPYFSGEST